MILTALNVLTRNIYSQTNDVQSSRELDAQNKLFNSSTGNRISNLLITIRLLYLLRHCHSILQYQHSSWTAEKDDIHLTSDNLTNLERHCDVDLRLLTSMNLTGQDSVLDCLASYLNCQLPACVCYRQTFTLSCQSINKLMYTCAYRLELRKWSLEKKTSSLHVLTAFENEVNLFTYRVSYGLAQ